MDNRGWYGFDLDGTLAEYHGWVSEQHIGKPIPAIARIFLRLIHQGKRVKIITARMSPMFTPPEETEAVIRAWLKEHFNTEISEMVELTNEKDPKMIAMYDDRCISVEANTGKIMYDPSK